MGLLRVPFSALPPRGRHEETTAALNESLSRTDAGSNLTDGAKGTSGVRSTEHARLIAALAEERNVMDVIVKAEPTDDVHGSFGQRSNQAKREGAKADLTGRAYPFHIAGPTDKHIKLVSVNAAPRPRRPETRGRLAVYSAP